MAPRGIEIHALQKKIRAIAEAWWELGKLQTPSTREFAKFSQIDYHTLKTAIRSGRLSVDLQEKLAQAAGFKTSDPTWIDTELDPASRSAPDGPAYGGRDTASGFRAALRRQLELPGLGTFVRVKNERPKLIDRNLAVFSIADSGQGAALGEANPLFLSLIVETGFHPRGFRYGFQKVRVRFAFDQKSRARMEERLGLQATAILNKANLEVRGDEHNPEWFLSIPSSVLTGEYVTTSEPLCVLTGAELGEEFLAELAVRPMDGAITSVDGRPLIDVQKRHIVELLYAKRLASTADSQGWISLALQNLRIVRADNA